MMNLAYSFGFYFLENHLLSILLGANSTVVPIVYIFTYGRSSIIRGEESGGQLKSTVNRDFFFKVVLKIVSCTHTCAQCLLCVKKCTCVCTLSCFKSPWLLSFAVQNDFPCFTSNLTSINSRRRGSRHFPVRGRSIKNSPCLYPCGAYK